MVLWVFIKPELADLDGDGDLDAVVGEFVLHYFENVGTAAAPAFVERTGGASPFNGVALDGFLSWPTLADVDGDGDLDAVVGDYYGGFQYLENTGSAAAPAYVKRTLGDNPFNGIDVGSRSAPALGDVDNDGDLDLVTGEDGGAVRYFENIGNSSAPAFVQRTGAANPFDGIDNGKTTSPTLADIDGDGDLDLVLGDGFGNVRYYPNTVAHGRPITVNVTHQGETIVGTSGNESLAGGTDSDDIDGGSGDDTLEGAAGDDILNGGDGDDYIRGGTGADTMTGGLGSDTYVVDDAGDVVDETGGDGVDLVKSHISWTLAAAVEDLTLGAAGHEIDGTGNSWDNALTGNDFANTLTGLGGGDLLLGRGGLDILDGGDGIDVLDGGLGNDLLYGGAGVDDLLGGGGHDRLDGGGGADEMAGGIGNDVYIVDNIADTVVELANAGTDSVESSVTFALGDNVEHLTLTGAGDIWGYGNAARNTITGNGGSNYLVGWGEVDTLSGGDGEDLLDGGADNDVLNGDGGDDELQGGLGNDQLFGGADEDVLRGQQGSDKLTGGGGADIFLFTSADLGPTERDQIFDLAFADGDVIDLSIIDANSTLGGDQAFVWATKFSKVAGQAVLKYVAATNITTLELDIDGDGKADFRIALTGDHAGTTGNLYTGSGDTDGGWLL